MEKLAENNNRIGLDLIGEIFPRYGKNNPFMFQTTNQMIWVWVNTYRYIFSGMNIPFTSYFGVH